MSIKDVFSFVWKKLTGKKAQEIAKVGVELIDRAEPLVKIFAEASGNTTLQSVVKGYETLGLPVSDALRDGKLTLDEVKALASLGVSLYLQRSQSVSGTEAGIAAVLGFANVKYGS